MRMEILGCNGGISGELRTMCLRVDDDLLIDAGSGAGDLSLTQVIAVNTVFLTHSHLDHCGFLPLLADAAANFRDTPLNVRALPETIAAIKHNILNGEIWPDYSALPSPDHPYLTFTPLQPGETVEMAGRGITALPARHAVPAVGYWLNSGSSSLVYSGDTTLCPEFWQALNRIPNLKYLLIETTFLNENAAGATRSGHMTAELLAQGLSLLQQPVELFIVHMESGREQKTMREVQQAAGRFKPEILKRGMVFEF
ncbi:MAG: 3',5'-cyclic-nucleotide phosphodiesterase [Gallionella sp.]|nr:3',5'-cyclic-nucleotide phosphodiesterase [Gallionella sp.]